MKHLNLPSEIKSLKDDGTTGTFSGYAAIFGNVDLGYDVIVPGAFTEIVKGRDGRVKVLYQHDMENPIGTATVTQDEKGLAFEGQIVLGCPSGAAAYQLMKAGALDGMSIGYDTLDADYTEGGVRLLKSVKLWEISPVTFGMNPLAGVDDVKRAAQGVKTIREFEDFLRDEGGFSVSQARALASGGFKALQTTRDEGDAEADLRDYLKSLCTSR